MTICVSCQARNSDHSTFCIRCGAEVQAARQRQDPGADTDAMPVVLETMPAALVTRAANRLAEGHVTEALADCRRAIALEPGNVEAHAILGMAYEQHGDLDAALEAYEAVLAIEPERTVERQKAALLRLRLDGRGGAESLDPGRVGPLQALWGRVTANPPVAVAVAAAVLVLVVGSIAIAHAARRARTQEAVTQAVAAGDQAFADGRYADALSQYVYAYELSPGDEQIRQRWDRAYQYSVQPPANSQVAQLPPKYIPAGPNARNPFEPVPIGGNQAQVPPPTETPGTGAAVAAAPQSAYDTWGSRPANPPSPDLTPAAPGPAPATTPTDRRGSPITPVLPKNVAKPSATTGEGDTTPQPPKALIEIQLVDRPARKPAAAETGGKSGSDGDALLGQAEQLARQGRTDEAIEGMQKAASAYDEAARSDPSAAAVHSQAAQSCRARIEVLRMSH
jgi:tetratricopeptide (TPR) repeat protein